MNKITSTCFNLELRALNREHTYNCSLKSLKIHCVPFKVIHKERYYWGFLLSYQIGWSIPHEIGETDFNACPRLGRPQSNIHLVNKSVLLSRFWICFSAQVIRRTESGDTIHWSCSTHLKSTHPTLLTMQGVRLLIPALRGMLCWSPP